MRHPGQRRRLNEFSWLHSWPSSQSFGCLCQRISVPVLLPCAGNFTVGAALRSGGYKGRITGCDITLYTTALGAYLAGHDLEIREKEDCPEHLKGFLDFSNMAHLAASVSIMLDLRQVWQSKNAWHRRVIANYRHDWPKLHGKKRWPSWKPTRPTLSRVKVHRCKVINGH